MDRIPRIQIPSPTIRNIPPPVVNTTPPPVVRGLQVPIIDVPNPIIEYPTIDIPTEEEFRQQMSPPPQESQPQEPEDTRDLPNSPPTPEVPVVPEVPVNPPRTITIGGVEAPLPEPAPLITAGATALVTTAVTLMATIMVGKLKDAVIEPMTKRMSQKKKKIKIKQIKPVIHYVMNEDSSVDILEYSQKGTKVLGQTKDVEKYIRDQVENDGLYEYDNKVIIDEGIKEKFTKEGAKRFKSLFAPAKAIVKKLSSKISF